MAKKEPTKAEIKKACDEAKEPCDVEGECCEAKKDKIERCCPDKKGCPKTKHTSLSKENAVTYLASIKDDEWDCYNMRKCKLVPYSSSKKDCCPGQTGHHIVPFSAIKKIKCANHGSALTICVAGRGNQAGTHGYIHNRLCKLLFNIPGNKIKFEDLQDKGIQACSEVIGVNVCDWGCIKKDLSDNHEKMSEKNSTCTKITSSTMVYKKCGIGRPGSLVLIKNRIANLISSLITYGK